MTWWHFIAIPIALSLFGFYVVFLYARFRPMSRIAEWFISDEERNWINLYEIGVDLGNATLDYGDPNYVYARYRNIRTAWVVIEEESGRTSKPQDPLGQVASARLFVIRDRSRLKKTRKSVENYLTEWLEKQ